jgi:DNA-binding NarL/FixJ family response regulator
MSLRQHTQTKLIRLTLVEPSSLMREGLVALLAQTDDISCAYAESDHEIGLKQCQTHPPEVALLGVSISDSASLAGVRLWQQQFPAVRIVLFDDCVRDLHLLYTLRMNLSGYTTKQDTFAEILEVIRNAADGGQAFTQRVQHRLKRSLRGWELSAAEGAGDLQCLTPREVEVMAHLAQGLSKQRCSDILKISPNTLDNHKARIMRKLRLHNSIQLTRLAISEGLIPP